MFQSNSNRSSENVPIFPSNTLYLYIKKIIIKKKKGGGGQRFTITEKEKRSTACRILVRFVFGNNTFSFPSLIVFVPVWLVYGFCRHVQFYISQSHFIRIISQTFSLSNEFSQSRMFQYSHLISLTFYLKHGMEWRYDNVQQANASSQFILRFQSADLYMYVCSINYLFSSVVFRKRNKQPMHLSHTWWFIILWKSC